MRQVLTNLWQDESAQDTSEYALLLLLITAALVAVVGTLSTTVQGVFSSVVGKLVPK
jgi:Flp pilus assembly pilin Flp